MESKHDVQSTHERFVALYIRWRAGILGENCDSAPANKDTFSTDMARRRSKLIDLYVQQTIAAQSGGDPVTLIGDFKQSVRRITNQCLLDELIDHPSIESMQVKLLISTDDDGVITSAMYLARGSTDEEQQDCIEDGLVGNTLEAAPDDVSAFTLVLKMGYRDRED
jgi:hypothetical protein